MSAARPIARRPAVGLDQACGDLDRTLRGIVAFNVRAPQALIEDACQTAWLRLTRRGGDLAPRAVLPWLVTTATREALHLVRRAERELPLEVLTEAGPVASPSPGPEAITDLRSRLSALGALNRRQQRLIWLQGLGFSYEEMASCEGASLRTIERQVLRARRALRSA
ncbi:MAG: sigma-70 family RNA polymerase sigma factor [Actinomycetota bacterium]|nr:sigma-70 family RNA polymerase sigma factor [Actinomycetota bacterium]